jgi:hypothetical protein
MEGKKRRFKKIEANSQREDLNKGEATIKDYVKMYALHPSSYFVYPKDGDSENYVYIIEPFATVGLMKKGSTVKGAKFNLEEFNDWWDDGGQETADEEYGKLVTKALLKKQPSYPNEANAYSEALWELAKKDNAHKKYAKGSTVKGGDKATKIEIKIDKEGRKIAKRTLVKANSKGEKVTYELTVGLHEGRKRGWFELYATDEDGEEYFYSEGGLWIEGGKITDYDGVYELSEKLKPLMSALNLNSVDVYEEGGSILAKGSTVKGGYSDTFKEIIDLGNETYFIRNWGHVGTEKFDKIELVAVATIRDLEDYMSESELPKEGNYELNITIVPTEKYLSKKHTKIANDDNNSMSNNSILNIVNYMGGLNYEPQSKVHFKTFEDAKKYMLSKELNDKISAQGMMSGFILDNKYNRMGQTNWDYLAYMTGESQKFGNGGGVAVSSESGYVVGTNADEWQNQYALGGGVDDKYKLTLKSWDADVYEDDYNEGEGSHVNSFGEKVNKSFSSGQQLLEYISENILYHTVKKENCNIMDDGRIVTSVLVDVDNSSASNSEIEEWKKGNKKLYSANYNFYVTLTHEKTPSEEELSKMLGISIYRKGGNLKKYSNGITKSIVFNYSIGGL